MVEKGTRGYICHLEPVYARFNSLYIKHYYKSKYP